MNRRRFSRHMPAAPTHPMTTCGRLGLFAVLAVPVAVFAYCLWLFPLVTAGIVLAAVAAFIIVGRFIDRRDRTLAAARPGDALTNLVRALDMRVVDPWVVRAVFEELQTYFPCDVCPFPVLPSDRIVDDYHIDPDDVGDMMEVVSQRAGYSLDQWEQNPHRNVATVRDMILFFNHQPRIRAA